MRRPLALMLMGHLIYLINAVLLQWGVSLNLFHPGVAWTTPLMVVGPGVFYALARSGWSRRFKDPAMVMAQGLYCALLTVLVYTFSRPEVRGFILCILPLIIMFGQFTMNGRQFAFFTGCTMSVLSAAVLLLRPYDDTPRGLSGDILELVYVALILGTATSIALIGSNIRQKLVASRVDLAEALSRVHALATTDELTGLANRRHVQDLLAEEVKRHRRLGQPLCVALLDLDHFKRYNDTYGHVHGDECLKQIGRLLREVCVRPRDVAARYGGEEFALILPRTPRSGAMTFARAVGQMLRVLRIRHPDSPHESGLTLSGGITTCVPDEYTSAEAMLMRADQALYAAKAQGRDRFFSFEMQMDTVEQRRT